MYSMLAEVERILELVSRIPEQRKIMLTFSSRVFISLARRPRSAINFSLTYTASSHDIGNPLTPSTTLLNTSAGKASNQSALRISGLHQSTRCGGTFDVERIGICGSTKNMARIFRCPGLEGSANLKGFTRCWTTLGKARSLPARVTTEPSSMTVDSSFVMPNISSIESQSFYDQSASRDSIKARTACLYLSRNHSHVFCID